MKVTLSVEPYGCYRVESDDGRSVFIQSDWDRPSLAASFGWSVRRVRGFRRKEVEGLLYATKKSCAHDGTDGTIPCPDCRCPIDRFIESATEWLDARDGKRINDPGYFGAEVGEV